MFETLENFQQLAINFQRQLLGAPGLLLVLVGLCVWLAGLRWRKLIAAAAAALLVTCVANVFTEANFIVITVISAITAIIAAVINRIVISAVAILIAVFITLTVFGWPTIVSDGAIANTQSDPNSTVPAWPEYEVKDEVIPAPEAVEITTSYIRTFADRVKSANSDLSTGAFASAGFVAIVIIVIALVGLNFLTALTCALLGTVLITSGMFLLLLYKGSEPVTLVAQAPSIYGMVFVAMVLLGAIVQLLLQRSSHKSAKTQKQDDEGETE